MKTISAKPSASDVATYILESTGGLTGYKLQKLLYYCQAWKLALSKDTLFDDKIKAYEYGPVVMNVSKQHINMRTVHASDVSGSSGNVKDRDKLIIDKVIDSYGSLSGDDLVALTHTEKPWADCYNGFNGNAAATIDPQMIYEYFVSLLVADRETMEEHHVPDFEHTETMYVSRDDFNWLNEYLKEEQISS